MSNDSSSSPRKSIKSSNQDKAPKPAPELDLWDLDDDEDETLIEKPEDSEAGSDEKSSTNKKSMEEESVDTEDDKDGDDIEADPDAEVDRTTSEEEFPGEDWSIEDELEPRAKPVAISPKPIKKKPLETKKSSQSEKEPVSKLETASTKSTSGKVYQTTCRPPSKTAGQNAKDQADTVEKIDDRNEPLPDLENASRNSAVDGIADIPDVHTTNQTDSVKVDVDNVDNVENIVTGQPGKIRSFAYSLSKLEKIGIAALLVIFAVGAAYGIIYFSNSVPTMPLVADKIDLPITGKSLVITELKTFWREPITSGENADVVRREAVLIPILAIKIKPTKSKAAIRVLFRNEKGEVVGDNLTKEVTGSATLKLPATDGYHDIGMHASYRTGDSLPWTIQVFEAPQSNSPSDKFTKLVETEISTDVR